MNRFHISLGHEEKFEKIWINRETYLENVKGFKKFNLIKGKSEANYTLYASHSTWDSEEDFFNWTKLRVSSATMSCELPIRLE